jgi:hypothetical protein
MLSLILSRLERFMSRAFIKIVFAAVLSTTLMGQACAITIPYFVEGESYTDESGNLWEFLGSFDVGSGPQYIDANNNGIEDAGDVFPLPLNGLQAAFSLGFGDVEDLAISAFDFDVGNGPLTSEEFAEVESTFNIDIVEVNFSSWYDGFSSAMRILSQDVLADKNGNGKYTFGTDNSAYVKDRSDVGDYTNYVFKSVKVSTPSTLLILALTLCGLWARQIKK